MLSNHPGMAQRIGQQDIDTAVPMPEGSLRPSLTANDVADVARQAPPAEPGAEPKQETAAPRREPAQPEPADSVESQQPIGAAVSMPETTLPPLTAKDIASSPNAAPAETAKAAQKQEPRRGSTPPPRTVRCPNNRSAPRSRCRTPHYAAATAKDIAGSPGAAPAETAKAAQKQETAPGVDPTTADSAVSQQPIGAAVSMPETSLRRR